VTNDEAFATGIVLGTLYERQVNGGALTARGQGLIDEVQPVMERGRDFANVVRMRLGGRWFSLTVVADVTDP